MSSHLTKLAWCLLLLLASATQSSLANDELQVEFEKTVQPLLARYCGDCHSGPAPKARLDLVAIQTAESVEESFEALRSATRALAGGRMPPEDEPQPTAEERQKIQAWFDSRYIHVAPRAAPLRPRRLSAHELRQTLRSMFGFDLEVVVTEAEETVSGQPPVRLEIEFNDFHHFNVAYYCGMPVRLIGDGSDLAGTVLVTKVRSLESLSGEKAQDAPG